MKKIGYFLIAVLCVVLIFGLCSCNFSGSQSGTDADLEGIYYAVKNGKFEPDSWFNISKDGTWTDDDDLSGTWTVRGNRICFNWVFSLDGIIDGDSFYLIELDEVVEYVKRDSAPQQGEFWTDKYVVLLDADGGSVPEEILKYHSGDKINLPTPEKENEKFKGWFDFYDKKYSTGTSMPAQNIALYAKWEKKVTDYSDEYVFFSPAIEGKKHPDEYYYLYSNISKYIYVELTCDSVGGKFNLGTPSNFDLLHHTDMKYHVQSSDYQLKWYYGDWSQPNGSQTFTLNYGSNIQLLAVENSQGQIQCRYLLDFYVKRDVEVELYRSISDTKSYGTVRGYVDEMIDEIDLKPYENDEFDYWLCYDSTTKSYKPYDFTTILTGDIALYQSLKGVEVNVDLDGGTMTEASIRIKPYEEDQIFSVAEKEGYDFIGWMDSDGNYYIGYDGSLLFAVANDKMPKKLTASFIPKKYYANISGKNVKFVDTEVYVIYGFTSVDKIGYKIANNIDNEVTSYLFEIGDEFYVSGYAIEGAYDGINKLNEYGKALMLTQDLLNKTLSLDMIKLPIKIEKNIDVAGSVKYDDAAYIGAELSITATTEAGFTFMGWYDGDTLLTSEDTYTFVLSAESKTYTAKWDTSYVVPEGTTSIGVSQFKNWDFLTSITIPNSVTSIGDSSFYGCTRLTSITIPDSVTSIGSFAFYGCSSLESITIPFVGANDTASNGYAKVFGYIFGYTTQSSSSSTVSGATCQYYSNSKYYWYYIPLSLKSVVISDGATSIPYKAFQNCTRLTSVTIGNGVTSIGSSAFDGCSGLTSITIPNSVTSIGDSSFYGCTRLTSITIPDSVTSIGSFAFYGCSSLESITIPFVGANDTASNGYAKVFGYIFGYTTQSSSSSTVSGATCQYYSNSKYYWYYIPSSLKSVVISDGATSIPYKAFQNCTGLTSVTIGNSVTSIGGYSFDGCTGLTSIYYTGDVAGWCGISGLGNLMSSSRTLYIDGNKVEGELIIPDSVTSIGGSAFYGCSGLTSVTIGSGVTSIGNYAFYNCTRLTSIYYTGDVAGWCGISGLYYLMSGSRTLYIDGNKVEGELIIPDSVTSIPSYAFAYCTGLTSVTISNGVKSIDSSAFYGCSGLTSITVPDSVTNIGSNVFYGCSGLTSVTIGSGVTSIGSSAFSGCTGLTTVNWNATACTSAGSYDYPIFKGCVNLATVNIGDNVTRIPSSAFDGCSGLTNVTIPDSVTSIGSNVFYGCSGLTSVTIGNGVTSIGSSVFYGCSGLTSITIPDSVTSIGFRAFYGCAGLISVTIPDSVTSIGSSAFSGCSSLESITIPFVGAKAGVTSRDTYQYPFGYIFGTSSYDGGVATEQKYYGSSTSSTTSTTYYIPSSLKSVTVTGGNILYRAFYNCSGLTSIVIPDNVTSIGYDAFQNCTGLTSITIPDSVTSIGSSAFKYCSKLVEVYNKSSLTITAGSSNNGYVAYYAKNVYTTEGGSKLSIDENGYVIYVDGDEKILVGYTGTEKELTLPSEITKINQYAFYNFTGLTSIAIPDSVTSIGSFAFSGCSSLESITIPFVGAKAGVTSRDTYQYPFGYIFGTSSYDGGVATEQKYYGSSTSSTTSTTYYIPSSLKSVTITGGNILYGAFYNFTGLTSIVIPDNVTSIGSFAFSGCSSLESITIPFVGAKAGVTSRDTYQYPFGYIFGTSSYDGGVATEQKYYGSSTSSTTSTTYYIPSSLKSVTVTGGNILYGAFYNCTGLTSVTIGNSVTSIGSSAFDGCSGLTKIYYTGDVTGWCGISGLYYLMSGSRTLYIDGNKVEGELIIPDSVTSIPSYAFAYCTGLTSVTISNGVKSIDSSAFYGCSGLTSITVPDSVTNIDYRAFYNCSGLTSIVIPDSVTSIGYDAFSGCTGLTSVTIGNSVTSIGGYSFDGCTGLTSITIPDSVTSIGSSAFYGCSGLTSIVIPDSVTSIGSFAFYGCSGLTSITIPDSVTSIGSSVFSGCTGLASITVADGNTTYHSAGNCLIETATNTLVLGCKGSIVPTDGSVTSIGDYAFRVCSGLTSITIPDSVTSIGSNAFYGCSGLTSVTIGSSVTSIGSSAFYNCTGLTSITIPDSVTSIGYDAFSGCTGLTSVTIGNSVTSIGSSAFKYCSKLVEVYNKSSLKITAGSSDNGYVAYYAKNVFTTEGSTKLSTDENGYVTYTDGSEKILVAYIGNETELILPSDITKIYQYAFQNCTGLTIITIPDSVTSIGFRAFYGCAGLISVTIPDSVTSMGDDAFSGCSSLESITIPFVGAKAGVTSRDAYQYPFGYIFGTSSYTGGVATEQRYYGSSTSYDTSTTYYIPSSLKSVTVTGGNILYGAFYNCTGLTSITIPDSVTSIGYASFYNCKGLTSITIPDSVTSIDRYAFQNCIGLTSITIPDSVTSIDRYAFQNCIGLTSVIFKDSSSWYQTKNSSDWKNKSGGALTNVTSATTNATYFTSTYDNYYWYKL